MLEGYVEFFMDPSLAECYVKLKEEVNKLLMKKVNLLVSFVFLSPSIDPFLSFLRYM